MKTDKEKTRTKKRVAFWFDSNLLILLDKLAKEKFGITRAAFVRLLTRQALVSHGLLESENDNLVSKTEEAN